MVEVFVYPMANLDAENAKATESQLLSIKDRTVIIISHLKNENGYWIYIDRFGNKREYLKGEEIDRYTNNYSIGLLDLDEKRFYYIKFDS